MVAIAPFTSNRARKSECEKENAGPADLCSHAGGKKDNRFRLVRASSWHRNKKLSRHTRAASASFDLEGTAHGKKNCASAPQFAFANSNNNQPSRSLRMERFEILFRKRMFETLVLPIDRHDPPTLAIMEQLYAVDPAHERFGIVRIMT